MYSLSVRWFSVIVNTTATLVVRSRGLRIFSASVTSSRLPARAGVRVPPWPWYWRARQRDTAGTAGGRSLGGAVSGSRRAVGLASEGRGESCRPATARSPGEPRPPYGGSPWPLPIPRETVISCHLAEPLTLGRLLGSVACLLRDVRTPLRNGVDESLVTQGSYRASGRRARDLVSLD